MQKGIFLNTFGKNLSSSFSTSSRCFSEFGAGNTILFQVKVFGGKINGTTLAMCLIKITARSSFTISRNIRQIDRTD